MKIVTTTKARENISELVNEVRDNNEVIGIGRRNKVEVLVIRYPEDLNKEVSYETNFNAHSSSFDFLKDEGDHYSVKDLKRRYV